ncbi:MAG: penicillin-binding protein 2 [Deltaproteobacteria bacterium]|nr:penicillin-binding protein 2 [Deltaproteobacteria bacterium]
MDSSSVPLPDSREAPNGFRRRLGVSVAILAAAFAFLIARFWQLQVTEGDVHRTLSENNRVRLKRVNAARGLIFDRGGQLLVENRPSFDVVMVPEDARQPQDVLERLGGFLHQELADARQALAAAAASRRPPFENVVLRRDVDWETLVAVETRQIELPGVSLQIGPRRSYLYGTTAAHLLGYVGEVSVEELQRLPGYRMGDTIGKYGLEKYWEDRLRGENGGQQIEVDAFGRKLRVLDEVPEVPGANIHLTLDAGLQHAAEEAMGDHEGSVVVLDPHDGAVLAMVSKPAFDPNLFARGITSDEWRSLTTDSLHPLANKALQGQYPPGSTFKIVVATAALEENIINPFTRIFCGGSLHYGNRDFRCWKKGGHGWVNLHEAIVGSCDVYFYQVGQRLGIDTIAQYARRYGLGAATGIPLDHERGGTIPDTQWKRQRYGEPWYSGETLSVAVGQGYVTATPLQMANLIAMVAAGGTRHRPHYVARVDAPEGVDVPAVPDQVAHLGVRSSTLAQVQSALRDVVMSERGTGRKARVEGIEVAGKTGTSQVVRLKTDRKVNQRLLPREQRDHAWFVSFAPVGAPEVAVACLIEHAGGGGGAMAAPVVQKVLAYYFEHRKAPREDGQQEARATR